MTEREYNKRLLERVRQAEIEERRRKEADEAEAKLLGGCLVGLFMLFVGFFKIIPFLLKHWAHLTQRHRKTGIIIMLFVLFIIAFIGGFLSCVDDIDNTSIGEWWIFLFGVAVFFVLPKYTVRALGWLKGIIFMLLFWFMFVAIIIIVDDMFSKIIMQESTLKLKGNFVNLRQSPNGDIISQIQAKDFDKIKLKRLGVEGKWLKVLYFPPSIADESKAITGYIHISLIDENSSQ